MRNVSTIILALVAASMLIGILGCTSLALTGAKKYKVEVTNVLLKMKAQIEQDGEITEATTNKLSKVLDKYETEFGKKSSYLTCKIMLDTLQGAETSGRTTFQINQDVMAMIVDVLDTLKTEVKV